MLKEIKQNKKRTQLQNHTDNRKIYKIIIIIEFCLILNDLYYPQEPVEEKISIRNIASTFFNLIIKK